MKEIPGKILGGRYRILSQLGKGAFGSTFLAEDVKRPGNPRCVVKKFSVPDEYRKGPSARELLHREAEILSSLGEHPQIPQLLDEFEEEQSFYFVWEFIKGQVLSYELRVGQRWSESETVGLLKEVLGILVFFEEQGFVHGDINPSNLIRRQSDGKIVVLIDIPMFRRLALEDESFKPDLLIGTLVYTAPEQVYGSPRPNSDIYALGMAAIQALTGAIPLHLLRDPKTGKVILSDRAEVSDRLATVLDRMVRHDFRDRYQSAREVVYSLELRLENEAQAARPIPPQSASHMPRQSFILIKSTSLVSVVLGLLLALLLNNAYSLFLGLSWFLVVLFLVTTVLYWSLIEERTGSGDWSGKNFWERGQKVVALAAGGAFLGGLTAQLTGAAIGTCLGAIFGYFYGEDGAASSYPASSDGESRDNIWKRGDRLIVFASGGVLLGGLIAQLPGAIMGATLGAAFGLLAKIDTN